MDTYSQPNVFIRPAKLEDASLVADPIYLSMGVEADWLFGQKPGYSTREVLIRLYQRKNNRASHCFAYIAAWNGHNVGLLLAYPGRLLQRLNWVTGLHLAQIFGLGGTMRVARQFMGI